MSANIRCPRSSHLLLVHLMGKVGGSGDRFGDNMCVSRIGGRNQFTNTKPTRPITKMSRSFDGKSLSDAIFAALPLPDIIRDIRATVELITTESLSFSYPTLLQIRRLATLPRWTGSSASVPRIARPSGARYVSVWAPSLQRSLL